MDYMSKALKVADEQLNDKAEAEAKDTPDKPQAETKDTKKEAVSRAKEPNPKPTKANSRQPNKKP
jgi:hypothetical protein